MAEQVTVQFVLYQCQVWINQPSLFAWIDGDVSYCNDMLYIMGEKHGAKYAERKEGMLRLKEQLSRLDPNTSEMIG